MMQKINKLKSILLSSVHFLYTKLIKPKSENEDNKRQEFILNILLTSSLLLYGTGFAVASYNKLIDDGYDGINPVIIFFIFLLFLALFYISRLKSHRLSAYLFIFLFLIPLFYAACHWGTDSPVVPLFTALVIIMSSILVSTRFSFIIAITIGLIFIATTYLQINGMLEVDRIWKNGAPLDITDSINYFIIFIVIATISWLSNREIEKSLKRARNSEKELQKEKELLEVRVEERTQELQKAQMEKMKEISRLAEFGRLSGGLFHDLINPLTALSFNIERIKKNQSNGFEDIEEDLDKALKVTERMRKFITSVKKQINYQEEKKLFSLNQEINEAMQVLTYRARKNNIEIRFNADEDVKITGNPIKFNQVILNLISNSIDVYDSNDQKRMIDVSLQRNNDCITIYVKDYGKGIPEEIKGKIFKDFFTTKENGTGIGLHLVKDIIEKDLNGEISFKSNKNGTTFIIVIKQKQL